MKQRKQVIMLPTENKSNFYTLIGNQNQQLYLSKDTIVRDMLQQNQHLYILSDEKPKKGNWVYNPIQNIIFQVKTKEIHYTNKKIIATTDTSLYQYGMHSEGRIKIPFTQISQDFIEYFIKEYNKGNIITEVDVEYNEINISACTCDNLDCPNSYYDGIDYACSKKFEDGNFWKKEIELKLSKDNTITIHPIKDSWSRKEVDEICNLYESILHKDFHVMTEKDMFKRIKELKA